MNNTGRIKGALANREKALKKYYENPNRCLNCGEVIQVRENEKPFETRKKKFCDHMCAASFNNKGTIHNKRKIKKCKNCGAEFFGKNTYCDKCISDGLQNKVSFDDLNDSRSKRKALIRERGHKCESCGNSHQLGQLIRLEMHHIDGDRSNNHRTNVQLLCPNCHSQTDNYGSKNKVGPKTNKQKERMKKYYEGKSY